MWEMELLGIDLYHILNWFYIYSFFGWLWESTYVSVINKKLVNRGFITGPFCTIYGCGALVVYLLLRPFEQHLLLIYLGGVLVATVLEYGTAVVMEGIFNTRWWDYSEKRFNFQGRICLSSSAAWGFFSVILFIFLQPAVLLLMSLYSRSTGKILVTAVTVLYGIDFITAAAESVKLKAKLGRLEDIKDEFFEYVQSTRLYESAEEFREKLGLLQAIHYREEIKNRLEERKEALADWAEEIGIADYRKEIEAKINSLSERYTLTHKKNRSNLIYRRFMNAYPNLKTKAGFGKKSSGKKSSGKE